MPENNDTKQQIYNLINIQKIDSQIFDLTSQKESFPVRLKEIDDILETKKTGMETADEALKQLQVAKNEKENDMQSKEELIKKHDGELFQIKNNKEYTALQQEIKSIQADVSILEEEIISLFDAIEAAQAKCNEEKKAFEEETKAAEQEKSVIKAEEKRLADQLTELKSAREAAAKDVDPEILKRYDRILLSRGRAAMSKIHEDFCGECNMHLRPQVINEATLKKNLVFCENCSRILYVEEE